MENEVCGTRITERYGEHTLLFNVIPYQIDMYTHTFSYVHKKL